MPETELSPDDVAEIFGGEVGTVETDADEIEVSLAVNTIRDHLKAAAKEDGVGINQLAHRLDISPSSVSRFLGGEGDVRVSTVVLYGRALGRKWDFSLCKDAACVVHDNHRGTPIALSVEQHVATATSRPTPMLVLSAPAPQNPLVDMKTKALT
jgi:transcriptional regulator with XRE-family HTH domain